MMSDEIKFNDIPSIIFGENRVSFIPAKREKEGCCSAVLVMLKREGDWKETELTFDKSIELSEPVVSMVFKDSDAIDVVISMLADFRDNYFGKTDNELMEG